MPSIETLLDIICTEAVENYALMKKGLSKKDNSDLPPIKFNEPILSEEDRAYFKAERTKYRANYNTNK